MNSECRGRVKELKEPGVETKTTYAMARLKGSLGGIPVSEWPYMQRRLARRSLGIAGHNLYGHCNGMPQRTTSVRVCKGSMILPLCSGRKTVPGFSHLGL
jgi:hypothetical protein